MTGLALIRKVPLLRSRVMPMRAVWHSLRKTIFDPYRPERHYMRGPGPKSRAKHGDQAGV